MRRLMQMRRLPSSHRFFGDMESQASKSLQTIADNTGIAENRMKGSYTQIAAFAKTTGLDTSDALSLADRAMVAVADSAAFYDRSLEETTESLQSFLKGNYENGRRPWSVLYRNHKE